MSSKYSWIILLLGYNPTRQLGLMLTLIAKGSLMTTTSDDIFYLWTNIMISMPLV